MADTHHLRPQLSLFRQGLIAVLVFMVPVFVALYVLTAPTGAWRLVLAVQIFATVIVGLAAVAFFRAGVWVDNSGLRERGFFGRMTTVPLADIDSTILASTFVGGGTESVPQLFVRGRDGQTLLRLRGQFWSRENINLVINTLSVPHIQLDDAMSRQELQHEYPGLLYWFERRPIIAALAFTVVIAAFGALVLLCLNLLGITPG